MSSVADILESEGRKVALPPGTQFRPGALDGPGQRAIYRQRSSGPFVVIAEAKRFPILMELADASKHSQALTQDHWEAAQAVALEADLAMGR